MLPTVFEPYIMSEEPQTVPVRPVQPYRFAVTQAEALEDLDMLSYLLDTAYSGREYWEKQGNSFPDSYRRIDAWIRGAGEKILIEDFLETAAQAYSFIHDGHMEMAGPRGEICSFAKTKKAYFADLLLEETQEGFSVLKSGCDALPCGSILPAAAASGHLFPTLSPPGRKHYLLGRRLWQSERERPAEPQLGLAIDGKHIELPLHPCRASEISGKNGVFTHTRRGNTDIVQSSRFWEGDDVLIEALEEEFRQLGQSLRTAPRVIWDLHDNHGGSSAYPWAFIDGLNGCADWPVDIAALSSPAILGARGKPGADEPVRKWVSFRPAPPRRPEKAQYDGTLYLLTSEHVGSSGEAAVSMAMNVKDLVIIGESTGGRGVFGDTLNYVLPHTGIVVTLPHKLFLSGAQEGIGFAPDYWLDAPDLLEETLRWLDAPEEYTAPVGQ